MYRCDCCKEVFLEPEEYKNMMACPNCMSDEYERVYECAECGDWFERHVLVGGLCPDCERKMLRRISDALDNFKQTIGETGLAYIKEEMEGFLDVS